MTYTNTNWLLGNELLYDASHKLSAEVSISGKLNGFLFNKLLIGKTWNTSSKQAEAYTGAVATAVNTAENTFKTIGIGLRYSEAGNTYVNGIITNRLLSFTSEPTSAAQSLTTWLTTYVLYKADDETSTAGAINLETMYSVSNSWTTSMPSETYSIAAANNVGTKSSKTTAESYAKRKIDLSAANISVYPNVYYLAGGDTSIVKLTAGSGYKINYNYSQSVYPSLNNVRKNYFIPNTFVTDTKGNIISGDLAFSMWQDISSQQSAPSLNISVSPITYTVTTVTTTSTGSWNIPSSWNAHTPVTSANEWYFYPAAGYTYPTSVTTSGLFVNFKYDNTTGIITFDEIQGDVSITGYATRIGRSYETPGFTRCKSHYGPYLKSDTSRTIVSTVYTDLEYCTDFYPDDYCNTLTSATGLGIQANPNVSTVTESGVTFSRITFIPTGLEDVKLFATAEYTAFNFEINPAATTCSYEWVPKRSSEPTTITYNDSYKIELLPKTGYQLPAVSEMDTYITYTGTATVAYNIENDHGYITIKNATTAIALSIAAKLQAWTVSLGTLSGCTATLNKESLQSFEKFSAVVYHDSWHYRLASKSDVTITNATFELDMSKTDRTTINGTSSGTGDIVVSVACAPHSYTITTSVTDCTCSGATTLSADGTAEYVITPNSGYTYPESITLDPANGASLEYDAEYASNGKFKLKQAHANTTVIVKAAPAGRTLTVTLNGSAAEKSRSAIKTGVAAYVYIKPNDYRDLITDVSKITATNIVEDSLGVSTETVSGEVLNKITFTPDITDNAITIDATCDWTEYSFSVATPSHGSWSWTIPYGKTPTTITNNSAYAATLVPDTGYNLPASISVSGIPDFKGYNSASGAAVFSGATGNTTVESAICTAKEYSLEVRISGGTATYNNTITYDANNTVTVELNEHKAYPSTVNVYYNEVKSSSGWTWTQATGTLVITQPEGNTIVTIDCPVESFAVESSTWGCAISAPATVEYGKDITATILASKGYRVPWEDEIGSWLSVSGISYSDYLRKSDTEADIILTNAVGDDGKVKITVACINSYQITFTLGSCKFDPEIDSIWADVGKTTTLALKATSGYNIPKTVSVTEGNVTATLGSYTDSHTKAVLTITNPTATSKISIQALSISPVQITAADDSQPIIFTNKYWGTSVTVNPGASVAMSDIITMGVISGITLKGAYCTNSSIGFDYAITNAIGSITNQTGTFYDDALSIAISMMSSCTIKCKRVPNTTVSVKGYNRAKYTELEYLENTQRALAATSYVDTQVYPGKILPFEIVFSTNDSQWSDYGFGNIFGSRLKSGSEEYQLSFYQTGTISIGTRNTNLNFAKVSDQFKISYDGTSNADNAVVTNLTSGTTPIKYTLTTSDFSENTSSITLFAVNQKNTGTVIQAHPSKIYSCKFGEVAWLVPVAILDADSGTYSYGMYDVIRKRDLLAAGGTNFKCNLSRVTVTTSGLSGGEYLNIKSDLEDSAHSLTTGTLQVLVSSTVSIRGAYRTGLLNLANSTKSLLPNGMRTAGDFTIRMDSSTTVTETYNPA